MKNKKTNLILSLSLFAFALTMTIAGSAIIQNENKGKFTSEVIINGADVKGYTVEQANKLVYENLSKEIEDINIEIVYKDKIWKFNKDDFEVSDAVKNVVTTAFKRSKFSNRDAVEFIASKTGNFNTALNQVFTNFDEKLQVIVDEIEMPAQNASVEFKPDRENMFNIVEAKNGIKVDKKKLISDFEGQFRKSKDIKIFVHTTAVTPEIKSDYFEDKLNLMSKFSTSIKGSQEGRRHNVTLALKKINGTVIKPQEIVSFNQITGPQNASGGYKDAVVILNGIFQNGMGGGICQASSTLYNACVLANMEIEEVHKHTLPVTYVELSLDAMVSDGYADLIFKNASDFDLYIKSYVKADDAVVEIYGSSIPEGTTIKRVAEFVGNIPHKGDKIVVDTKGEYSNKVLYKGEYYRLKYPREGYEAKAFKEYYKNGQLQKREEIRHEKYQPLDGIIIEGAQDLPEGFVLPKQTVEFIKPQAQRAN